MQACALLPYRHAYLDQFVGASTARSRQGRGGILIKIILKGVKLHRGQPIVWQGVVGAVGCGLGSITDAKRVKLLIAVPLQTSTYDSSSAHIAMLARRSTACSTVWQA